MTNWFASTQRGFVVVALGCFATSAIAQKPTGKVPSPAKITKAAPVATPPAWARDAKWYDVYVPQFRNGDPSNDPPATAPWTAKAKTDPATGHNKILSYGGDLAGLQSKLPYLKALGINTIYVSDIFRPKIDIENVHHALPSDLRHIADLVGVKDSAYKITGETADPKTWKFSESDRLLHQLVRAAHEARIRVVMQVPLDVSVPAALLTETLRRWMDPNGDGNPADGVDGWTISRSDKAKDMPLQWQKAVKGINPNAITVAMDSDKGDNPFDLQISKTSFVVLSTLRSSKTRHNAVEPDGTGTYPHFGWFNRILFDQEGMPDRLLHELGSEWNISAMFAAALKEPMLDSKKVLDTLRLAMVIQHFLPGAPMTYFGEEVGMRNVKDDFSYVPMWWNDLPGKETKSKDYREDLQSLVQWLHLRRDIDEPLRRGKLRTVLVDDETKILVLARTMPDKEIVLVMNCSDKKQKVMVPVGHPGEMVALLTPHLTSGPRARKMPAGAGGIRPLPMGGNKQLVNHEGEVRVWIKPMAVRYVLHEAR